MTCKHFSFLSFPVAFRCIINIMSLDIVLKNLLTVFFVFRLTEKNVREVIEKYRHTTNIISACILLQNLEHLTLTIK